MQAAEGNTNCLFGKLQERDGSVRDRARTEISDFKGDVRISRNT